MESKDKKKIIDSIFCIFIGTSVGLIVYGTFLYYNIAIVGWNLGLIFAPLAAGYVETIFANRAIGRNIGAISAFILFIYTTFYSFILKNPTLGFNFITAGAIVVILQAAFPTLINYIFLVVIGGAISNLIKKIKDLFHKIIHRIRHQQFIKWNGPDIEPKPIPNFDEDLSNKRINSLDFFFLTNTDMETRKHKIVGIYQSYILIERDLKIIHPEPELNEKQCLTNIKEGKDECLIQLAENIKNDGGNGIMDLEMTYNLIGIGGDNIQITARGMGIYVEYYEQ